MLPCFYPHAVNAMLASHWDRLPEEIKNRTFMYTDLDTVILNKNKLCIQKFLRDKSIRKTFNWTYAASHGKTEWMKYFLSNGIKQVYYPTLLESALKHSQFRCAEWIWDQRMVIRRFLWERKHQRNHNQLATERTLTTLLKMGKIKEATWLLDNTTVPFEDYAIGYASAPIRVKMMNCTTSRIRVKCASYEEDVKEQMLIRSTILKMSYDSNEDRFQDWWTFLGPGSLAFDLRNMVIVTSGACIFTLV